MDTPEPTPTSGPQKSAAHACLEAMVHHLSCAEHVNWDGLARTIQDAIFGISQPDPLGPKRDVDALTAALAELLVELRARDRNAAMICGRKALTIAEGKQQMRRGA